jgi:hypothetical protein
VSIVTDKQTFQPIEAQINFFSKVYSENEVFCVNDAQVSCVYGLHFVKCVSLITEIRLFSYIISKVSIN